MRVLLVSYYFPPAAGGGVQRALAWSKYLPEFGVEVEVLTPSDPRWVHVGGVAAPAGTIVHRTRINPTPRSFSPADRVGQSRGVRRAWQRLAVQPRRLLLPDTRVGWAPVAARLGKRVVRERAIDLVISTSPPETDHLVAARIARATGVPWVADFRDSWLDLPHLRLDDRSVRVKHSVNRWLAARTIDHAQAITTVSEPLAADLRRRHTEVPVHVVTNGIDFEDLADLPPADVDPATFTIAYTGNFFGRQSPEVFLRGLSALLARRPEVARSLAVRFVGRLKPVHERMVAADPHLHSVVQRTDFLPYREVLALQRAADMLLLYVAPGPGSAGVFTGKVFEYVAARRPVLAQAPAGNVAAGLVRAAGSGDVLDPDLPEAVELAIESAWERWRTEGRAPDIDVPAEVLARISRRDQARELAGLLHALVDGPA